MMFSTGEQLPFSVYGKTTPTYITTVTQINYCMFFFPDQWNNEFIHFLLDTIESPPDTDTEDAIPDAFVNVLLSFNQHFEGT